MELSSAGAQVPVMPLVDVVGNGFSVWPWQMGPTGSKTGAVLLALTTMVSDAADAHCPAAGVKV